MTSTILQLVAHKKKKPTHNAICYRISFKETKNFVLKPNCRAMKETKKDRKKERQKERKKEKKKVIKKKKNRKKEKRKERRINRITFTFLPLYFETQL